MLMRLDLKCAWDLDTKRSGYKDLWLMHSVISTLTAGKKWSGKVSDGLVSLMDHKVAQGSLRGTEDPLKANFTSEKSGEQTKREGVLELTQWTGPEATSSLVAGAQICSS
jgi:hypothetical protein